MKELKCPKCGYVMEKALQAKCLRCGTIINCATGCSGNCLKCAASKNNK